MEFVPAQRRVSSRSTGSSIITFDVVTSGVATDAVRGDLSAHIFNAVSGQRFTASNGDVYDVEGNPFVFLDSGAAGKFSRPTSRARV